jgi:hypothetical protein
MERDLNQLTPSVDLQVNLCQFGQRVSQLCELESDRHLSAKDAYDEIRNLWLQLTNSSPEILDFLAKLSEREQLNL